MPPRPRLLLAPGRSRIAELVLAPERLLHKAAAERQQIGADLTARAGEGVESVEVYVVGELGGDAGFEDVSPSG